MTFFGGLFSGWGKNSDSDQKEDTQSMDDNVLPFLDNVPDLVLLHLFDYLDRASINKLRQISATARDVADNIYGLHVIVPPRDWNPTPPTTGAPAAASRPPIHPSVITHIVTQMEGKVIQKLEMTDMPAPYAPFDCHKALQLPRRLRHLHLKYCGARLIFDVLTKCQNLVSLQYTSSTWRSLPVSINIFLASIPIPATGDSLLREINNIPTNAIKLDHLTKINLSINRMTRNSQSDWGNVILILLMMPRLPSLTIFEFGFHPKMLISWRTQMGILSCLAEFLLKAPNLKAFEYHSTFDTNSGTGMFSDWRALLFGMIDKYGSAMLKDFGQAAANNNQFAAFDTVLQHVRNMWNAAGTLLRHLRNLDIHLGNVTEHAVLMNLVSSLPTGLTNVKITDMGEEDDEDPDEMVNAYSYFAVPLERNRRLAVYNSVQIVHVNLKFTRIQPTSLTKILQHLPQLKELEFRQNSAGVTRLGVVANEASLEDFEDSSVFQKLEKLSLINVCLWYQQARLPVLAKFKSLRELNIVIHENVLKRWIVMPGIHTNDMMKILASLPKLNKVHVKPLISPPAVNAALFSGQGDNGDPMVVRDERNRRSLEKLGRLVRLDLGAVAQNVRRPSAYEFSFNFV